MSVGVAMSVESRLRLQELKDMRSFRFITFKIEQEAVVTDTLGTSQDYEEFIAALPMDECRYAVYDLDLATDGNSPKRKICLIYWFPEQADAKSKMMFAASMDLLGRAVGRLQVKVYATEIDDIGQETLIERASRCI